MAAMGTLHQYLRDAQLPQARFAAAVGISKGYASELVAGTKTPSLALALRIERFTEGQVTAASWLRPASEAV